MTASNQLPPRRIVNFAASDRYRAEVHGRIVGGAHTYSKGDDQFPVLAPAAIARGKGARVWDLDGNEYVDCGLGLGSVSLGHAYEPVLDACSRCGEPGPHRYFAVAMGGLVCGEHRPPGAASVSPSSIELMVALLSSDWAVADAADDRAQRETSGLIAAYLQWHLERGLRSLRLVERA